MCSPIQTQHSVHGRSSMEVIFTILMLFRFFEVCRSDPMESIEAKKYKILKMGAIPWSCQCLPQAWATCRYGRIEEGTSLEWTQSSVLIERFSLYRIPC